jgi:uncharacterized protein YndB with AHSA1/START domain
MVQQENALKVTLPSDTEFVMTRTFNAPRELVFDALTKPEHIVRWFGRSQDMFAVCEVDLRVGGTARFVWRFDDGSQMGITWVFKEITPPEQISFSETFDDPYREEMGGTTANVFALEEQDGKTTLTGTTTYKTREERDRARATGMEGGAAEVFDRLEELLEALQR